MNLFTKSHSQVDLAKLKQIKDWVYHNLDLHREISISISQLQCHEPDCPPLETVIAVMTNPPQQYKIHKPASQITEVEIKKLLD
ncbi:hypothetical protein Xen7305DRAFT_00013170 [Xenococcus sp. PCC 7305]|uniref:hypothetical protein n=1 Tax=Xenococcus sp. PCC 7305 TaxID=102125 RepID=UPI0002AC11FA|nr:hypothetical protein [Xenococcus sp. PCC 7305]ELS01612.1 hypothetical protein Xen7305DRAFT_00013170 [Xenococcus sp. PCC 7305]